MKTPSTIYALFRCLPLCCVCRRRPSWSLSRLLRLSRPDVCARCPPPVFVRDFRLPSLLRHLLLAACVLCIRVFTAGAKHEQGQAVAAAQLVPRVVLE